MSQQRTKKKMAERRVQRRRQSQIRLIIGISIVAVVVVGVIALITFLPDSSNAEEAVGDYEGIPQTIDRSGAIALVIGEPEAPVTLLEYSDFSCSHCATVAEMTGELLDKYVHDGQLRIVYKPVSFVNPTYSEPASRATVCAAEQGQGWQMMDRIWGLGGPGFYTEANLAGLASDIGLNTSTFKQCFDSSKTAEEVGAVNEEAVGMGINATPTLFINGEPLEFLEGEEGYPEALTRSIEAALGG